MKTKTNEKCKTTKKKLKWYKIQTKCVQHGNRKRVELNDDQQKKKNNEMINQNNKAIFVNFFSFTNSHVHFEEYSWTELRFQYHHSSAHDTRHTFIRLCMLSPTHQSGRTIIRRIVRLPPILFITVFAFPLQFFFSCRLLLLLPRIALPSPLPYDVLTIRCNGAAIFIRWNSAAIFRTYLSNSY